MSWHTDIVNREASLMLNNFKIDPDTLVVTAKASTGETYNFGVDPYFVETAAQMVDIARDIVSDRRRILDMIMTEDVLDDEDTLPELDPYL